MLILRSLLANVVFYVNLSLWLVFAAFPALLLPRRYLVKVAAGWSRSALFLMRVTPARATRSRGSRTSPVAG
jgi:1-acyl-sn-glycerol-3-phosphate acyltransferase